MAREETRFPPSPLIHPSSKKRGLPRPLPRSSSLVYTSGPSTKTQQRLPQILTDCPKTCGGEEEERSGHISKLMGGQTKQNFGRGKGKQKTLASQTAQVMKGEGRFRSQVSILLYSFIAHACKVPYPIRKKVPEISV